MERKGASEAVVTEEQVTLGLRGLVKATSEEEKVLRMRYGAKVATDVTLPLAAEGNSELQDELLVIEMQLLRSLKARKGAPKLAVARNAAKDKIVRALRKKK